MGHRRTGELLREMDGAKQRQTKGKPSRNVDGRRHLPELKDLGITRDQSSDWQKLAAIPEPEFERRLAAAAQDPKTMTTAKILRSLPPTKPKPAAISTRVSGRWSRPNSPR